jgi:hypothetical protein
VLLRLGELICLAEGAAVFAKRAALAAAGALPPKSHHRLSGEALAAAARVYAREAAARVADEGLRLVVGAGSDDGPTLAAACGLPAIQRAQAGLLADQDRVADGLYERSPQG